VGEGTNVLGVSTMDCGDVMSSNIAFAFSGNRNMSIDGLAVDMIHEMGHTLGLSHLDDQHSIMNPYVNEGVTVSFRDQLISIPDDSGCNGATSQNSYQTLMNNVGPDGQDLTGPSVVIDSPLDGAYVAAGSQVTATISDESGIDYAEMQVDADSAGTLQSAPWVFTIPASTAAGTHLITVRAYDNAGNNARARINITVTSGDEIPCDGDQDCDGDWVCRGDICVPPGTPGVLGDSCDGDQDCASNLCGAVGDQKLCTQRCDDTSPCPDGFDCLAGTACWPNGDDGGDDGDGGGGGCSVGEVPSSDAGALVLLLGALWLGRGRRRRR
jgi:MYXO-CTERM domain-containing protein